MTSPAPDVVLGDGRLEPKALFDLKTGIKGIQEVWETKVRNNLPGDFTIGHAVGRGGRKVSNYAKVHLPYQYYVHSQDDFTVSLGAPRPSVRGWVEVPADGDPDEAMAILRGRIETEGMSFLAMLTSLDDVADRLEAVLAAESSRAETHRRLEQLAATQLVLGRTDEAAVVLERLDRHVTTFLADRDVAWLHDVQTRGRELTTLAADGGLPEYFEQQRAAYRAEAGLPNESSSDGISEQRQR